MPEHIVIRRFKPEDEEAVRRICFNTGFLGRPASEWVDMNEAMFTDIWLLYHFRVEPDLILLAEAEGNVIGYITGCSDSLSKERWMHGPFVRHAVRQLLSGRYRFGRRTIAMLFRLLRDKLQFGTPDTPRAEYPAHLHYNIAPEYRSAETRLGIRLGATFFALLLERGITRCHGFLALREKDMGRRYKWIGTIHDKRRTRVYENVSDEPFYLVTVVVDVKERTERYRKHFNATNAARSLAEGNGEP